VNSYSFSFKICRYENFKIWLPSLPVRIIFAWLIFPGCHKATQQQQLPSIDATSIPSVLQGAYLGELRLPDQTTTEILNGGSTVRFHFPRGIYLVGRDTAGQIRMLTETDFTCTGDCTEGCNVFYIRKHFACSQCEPGTISCTGKSLSLSGLHRFSLIFSGCFAKHPGSATFAT